VSGRKEDVDGQKFIVVGKLI